MSAPRTGKKFGQYTLLERIAVGGMAEIFLARKEGVEGFEKTIVLKRIRPHLSQQKSFTKMFLNEAKLAAQLSHPNIVQIYDLGLIGDSYFIAMEYVHGRDMSRVLPKAAEKGISFPLEYALKVVSNVLEGLHYAHNRADPGGTALHIVHRDVTPENLMVAFSGAVKILDFGIAKAESIAESTKAGEIKGKLTYMSPEQCLGKKLDHRSDIFSIGVVLYEWVTGFKLFTGDNELAIMNSIIEGPVYPPSYFREGVPEPVEVVLMKALSKDPDLRYQSAWDMQVEIDAFLAANPFKPASTHLANFMKQLFADELEQESSKIRQRPVGMPAEEISITPSPAAVEGESEVLDLRPSAIVREPTSNTRGSALSVTIPLTRKDYQALTRAAKARSCTPEQMLQDLLATYLKYIP